MLEIVQIVSEFSTDGGVETVSRELARAWSFAKISNKVLTCSKGGKKSADACVEQVASWLSWLPTRGSFRYIGRLIVVPIFTLLATLKARRYSKTAVIVSHGDSLGGDVLVVHAIDSASIAEKKAGGRWRWRFNPMHGWVGWRDHWMIGGLRYNMYVAVSARVAKELQKYYSVPADRIRVISNGVDLKRFKRDESRRQPVRANFGIPLTARLLLFVGHEFDRKGLAFAIGALKKLSPDVWLLVVGSDNPAPYRRLAAQVRDRVVFAGPQADMPAFYSASDAFVLPTAYETFSLVCMEAMACGVPVFATRVGGIEDYLIDGVNGYAIARDETKIAEVLDAALRDEKRLDAMREGARLTAQDFGWDAIAAQYTLLLNEVWEKKASALGLARYPAQRLN